MRRVVDYRFCESLLLKLVPQSINTFKKVLFLRKLLNGMSEGAVLYLNLRSLSKHLDEL